MRRQSFVARLWSGAGGAQPLQSIDNSCVHSRPMVYLCVSTIANDEGPVVDVVSLSAVLNRPAVAPQFVVGRAGDATLGGAMQRLARGGGGVRCRSPGLRRAGGRIRLSALRARQIAGPRRPRRGAAGRGAVRSAGAARRPLPPADPACARRQPAAADADGGAGAARGRQRAVPAQIGRRPFARRDDRVRRAGVGADAARAGSRWRGSRARRSVAAPSKAAGS